MTNLLEVSQADIYPHMSVLPMGFSWVFHLAHMAHVELATWTLPSARLIRDRRPAPVMGKSVDGCKQALLIYADNANHLNFNRERVSKDQREMIARLHQHGLSTHDLLESATLCESWV